MPKKVRNIVLKLTRTNILFWFIFTLCNKLERLSKVFANLLAGPKHIHVEHDAAEIIRNYIAVTNTLAYSDEKYVMDKCFKKITAVIYESTK